MTRYLMLPQANGLDAMLVGLMISGFAHDCLQPFLSITRNLA